MHTLSHQRLRNLCMFLVTTLLTMGIISSPVVHAQAATGGNTSISEYPVPTFRSQPMGITTGSDGNIWFTESMGKIEDLTSAGTFRFTQQIGGSKIGRITPAGVISEYSISSQSMGITAGPDGNLWFTEPNANQIGCITPQGVVSEYPIISANSLRAGIPGDITTGSDGNIWFTEPNVNQIGRITPQGVVSEYAVPTASSAPAGITAGPDGNLWFTELGGNKIGRITPGGTVTFTEYPVLAGSAPAGITAGPDGNLWFTELGGNKIGRIAPGGVVSEYTISTIGSVPMGITAGPDGNLWFTELRGNEIGRITPGGTGTISEYTVPTMGSQPMGITAGPDGNIWFAELRGNKIGRFSTLGLSASPINAFVNKSFQGTVATGTTTGSVGNLSATIDWGDGHTTAGTITDNGGGTFSVSGTYTYTALGNFSVIVTVTDTSGATQTSTATATVTIATSVLKISGTLDTEGHASVLITFTDADLVASDYQVSIDWRDGTVTSGKVIASRTPGNFVILARHRYPYTHISRHIVYVTISDSSGNTISVVVPVSLSPIMYS